MKKQIFFSAMFLFLLIHNAFTQYSKVGFGIIPGVCVNENSYSFDDKSNYLDTSFTNTPKASYSIGMFAKYDVIKSISIRLQGQFVKKTSKSSLTSNSSMSSTYWTFDNSISYFQFSLLPQYNLPFFKNDFGNIVYFNGGGYLSFKTGANEYSTADGKEFSENDISSRINDTDAGLIIGIGIISEFFILDVSYSHGLTNIANQTVDEDFLSIKNRSLIISIGYKGDF